MGKRQGHIDEVGIGRAMPTFPDLQEGSKEEREVCFCDTWPLGHLVNF